MPDITEIPDKKENSTTSQIVWFIGLYCAGLIVTGVVVYLLRGLLGLN